MPLQADTLATPKDRPARYRQLSRVGPWRLGQLLDTGTWTEVYLAAPLRATISRADYVVKILKPRYCGEDSVIEMLRREAFLGRRLAHPHLTSVLAAHVDGPPYYLVMPYVRGVSLHAALQHAKRLITPYALWIARQAAEGIGALHEFGWQHADVKPHNIFVACNGHVTLIDLGLARPLGHSIEREAPLAGTPAYGAPELFSCATTFGPASDIYSLGITLFEMLTGVLPFASEEFAELCRMHLEQPPINPRHFVPALPVGVSRLLQSMLAKDPLRRPDLNDLIHQLVELEIDTLEEIACA